MSEAYPVTVAVGYPERQSRWKALLRLPLLVPLVVFAYLLGNFVVAAIWAAILVSGRIPRWLFDFQVAVNRWWLRVLSYSLLLTDQYPPFEGEYPVRYEVQYPERLARWKLVVWKLITVVPQLIVLEILTGTLVVVVAIGWFAILITGRFPRGLHWYVAGVLRWWARVQAYAVSLTDEFPPFSLSPDAGPGGKDSYVISSVVGLLATAGVIALFVVGIIFLEPDKEVVQVSYERLLAGDVSSVETRVVLESASIELTSATDPADELAPLLVPQPGYRFVTFDLLVQISGHRDVRVQESDYRLEDREGESREPLLVVVDGRPAPVWLRERGFAVVNLLLEVPQGVGPAELRCHFALAEGWRDSGMARRIVYEFQ